MILAKKKTHGAFPWVVCLSEFVCSPAFWRTEWDLRQPRRSIASEFLASAKPRRFFGHRTRKIAFTMPSLLVWIDLREVFAFSAASSRRKCAGSFTRNLCARRNPPVKVSLIEGICEFFCVRKKIWQWSRNRWISRFADYKKVKAFFWDLTASPSVLTLRFSASGGQEPFSEEKGSWNSKKTFSASRCLITASRKFRA